ncbi:MAG: HAMP domain-containing histidine kinase [Armatimonadetes bacterium]|nr:HAMP domain-containing histidine kinase [Armatimonadota bacterium]
MSFRLRLVFLSALSVMIAVLLTAYIISSQTRKLFFQSIDRELEGRAMGLRDRPPGAPGPEMSPDRRPPNRGPDPFGRPVELTANGMPEAAGETPYDLEALKLARPEGPVFTTVTIDDTDVRVVTVMRREPGQGAGYIQVGHNMADFKRLGETQSRILILLVPATILAAGIAGWLLADRALKPVQQIARTAERVTHSDLGARLNVSGQDELAQLATSFNEMLGRLSISFEEREKLVQDLQLSLEQQRQFVADASHELRTPLARLMLTTSSALQGESDSTELRKALEIADQAGTSMSKLVDQLLTLARAEAPTAGELPSSSLHSAIHEALDTVQATPGAPIEASFSDDISVLGDVHDLSRVVINLLTNARRYTSEDGCIKLLQDSSGEWARVVVADNGCGISPEHLEKLGQRFYRVDASRARKEGGTGLGLAICRAILNRVGGRLEIQSELGTGTRVSIFVPVDKNFSENPVSK